MRLAKYVHYVFAVKPPSTIQANIGLSFDYLYPGCHFNKVAYHYGILAELFTTVPLQYGADIKVSVCDLT